MKVSWGANISIPCCVLMTCFPSALHHGDVALSSPSSLHPKPGRAAGLLPLPAASQPAWLCVLFMQSSSKFQNKLSNIHELFCVYPVLRHLSEAWG